LTKAVAIRAAVAARATQRSQAALYGVSPAAICRVVGGDTWTVEPMPSLQSQLRGLGVLGRKHIPRQYLEASPDQRLALLQGLMDTDGHISNVGYAEFCTTNAALAGGVQELVRSLGIVAFRREDRARLLGVDMGPRYRIGFKTDKPVFRLRRKLERLRQVGANWPSKTRRIVGVTPTPSVPVRCIQVDSENHLYLAGRACIPTHNTSWCLNVILEIATQFKVPVAMFSLEMSKDQLVERLLCEHARIDAQRMHRGQLSDAEYDRLAQSLGPLSEAPIFIDDAPTLDELTVLLKSRQIHLREKVGMIIIDYLQLMHGRSRGDDANRVQEVSAISRALKMVARELKVPIIAISQLSRAVEQRTDKRPMLSDLRESGSIEQDSDQVIFLYRDDYYKDDVRPGIAEVILAKNRNGPTGKAELRFVKEQTRFYNLEARRPEPAQ
jgi:replicative DNA helicase